MQREEKQLETSIDSIVLKLNEIKAQLVGMLYKIDHERDSLQWPTFLDNFALLSGQVRFYLKSFIYELCSKYSTPSIYIYCWKEEKKTPLHETHRQDLNLQSLFGK